MKHARKANVAILGALAVTAVACVVGSFVGSHLVYNWTESVPRGLYWVTFGSEVDRGDLAVSALPTSVEALVRDRKYLPPGAVLLKPVAAVGGDHVCTTDSELVVNGTSLGEIRANDSFGRPLPRAELCRVLERGEIVLASNKSHSFDSRVFGPVTARHVRGKGTAVWTY